MQFKFGSQIQTPAICLAGISLWFALAEAQHDWLSVLALLRSAAQVQEFDSNFHNTFPYELTSDQIKCLEDVYKDLSLIKPMNRVICGDTGFGKTEIAMRAANLVTYKYHQLQLGKLQPIYYFDQQFP